MDNLYELSLGSMVIFIFYLMKQICNQCHNDYDVEEFNPCEIRSIMEEEQLCFKCAFWKWQLKLDKEVRPKENVIPLVRSTTKL